MEMIEYRWLDKSAWGDGPWQSEPDKRQWPDEATGLPCLMVRGTSGSWCGYVGVVSTHPAYGQDSDKPDVEVHGGLTFAHGCADQSRAAWEEFCKRNPTLKTQAERFPNGDAARALKKWEGCFEDYGHWRERMHETAICHLPEPGEPDDVWWFGFDCAHAGDLMPGINAVLAEIGSPSLPRYGDETYRDVAYVAGECARLAQQLAAIE